MKIISKFFYVIIILAILSSCTSNKKLIYLQDKGAESTIKQVDSIPEFKYYLQPKDVVYVKVLSIDETTTRAFNIQNSASTNVNSTSLYLNSYSINDSGYIDLPVIGQLKIAGKTVEEAKTIIQEKVNEYFNQATVILKMVSYKVTVLGEVHNPGMKVVYSDQLTVLEALGLAGDLTDVGNRENIKIVRPTKEGTQIFTLNITDKNIIYSDSFYLMPNDVIYVEPLKSKRLGITTVSSSIQFFISITSLLSTFIILARSL